MNERRFKELAEVLEKVSETSSKLEKISRLSIFLKGLSKEELQATIRLITSRIFPPWHNKELQVGYATLSSIIIELSNVSEENFFKIFIKHGDLGKAAEEILSEKKIMKPLVSEELTILNVYNNLAKIAEYKGEKSQALKKNILRGIFMDAKPIEAKYLVKIITKELRIGLSEGLLEEAIAEAFNIPVSQLREKVLILPDLSEVAILARESRLEEIDIQPMRPTSFMLAEPMSSAEEIANYFNKPLIAEFKYDGIRAQLHKIEDKIKIFSRRLDEISFYLTEIVESLRKLKENVILDAEILSFKDGKPLPFNVLQRRLRRKEIDKALLSEIPLQAIIYDILYLNGEKVYNFPLLNRKLLLSKINFEGNLKLSEYKIVKNSSEIQELFEESLEKGYEGLMLKDPDSIYTPGKRGKAWVKLKKEFDTIDAVIVAAEYGHGKRAGVLSDYTFAVLDGEELKVIGKAYSGLTDDEIEMLDKRLREITIRDLGYKIIVKPEIVIEVAFDSIQESDRHDSGFALRFPRIKRIRFDKSVQEIDTLDKIREIYVRKRSLQA